MLRLGRCRLPARRWAVLPGAVAQVIHHLSTPHHPSTPKSPERTNRHVRRAEYQSYVARDVALRFRTDEAVVFGALRGEPARTTEQFQSAVRLRGTLSPLQRGPASSRLARYHEIVDSWERCRPGPRDRPLILLIALVPLVPPLSRPSRSRERPGAWRWLPVRSEPSCGEGAPFPSWAAGPLLSTRSWRPPGTRVDGWSGARRGGRGALL